MTRTVRYQGAVMRDDHMLLVQQGEIGTYTWWNVPGGGIEPGETGAQCVVREILEETGLTVRVERLLLDDTTIPHNQYQRFVIYHCASIEGVAVADGKEALSVTWLDLRDDDAVTRILNNNLTVQVMVQHIRQALGYI